jgi:hypothetical protein
VWSACLEEAARTSGIAIELTDQRQVVVVLAAKSCRLAGAIARVTHKDALTLREPADAASEQEPGNMGRCFVARFMGLIPFWGTIQGNQDWQSPRPRCTRQRDEHRDNDPFMAPSVSGVAVRRPDTITMSALAKHLWPRVLGDCIITRQEDRAWRDDMVQQESHHASRQCPC